MSRTIFSGKRSFSRVEVGAIASNSLLSLVATESQRSTDELSTTVLHGSRQALGLRLRLWVGEGRTGQSESCEHLCEVHLEVVSADGVDELGD